MSQSAALPRRLSAEDRRSQILEQAAQLFVERGFESVGMADLAAELNISRPAIYSYFASTEEMLDALLQARLEGLPQRLAPFLGSGEQPTRFGELFLVLLEERDLLMLLNSGGGPLFRQKRYAFFSAVAERLQLSHLPRTKNGDPAVQQLIFLVVHLLSSSAYAQLTEQPAFDPTELAGTLNTFVLGGVEALLEPGEARQLPGK